MIRFDDKLIPYAFALLIALPFFILLRQFVHTYIRLKDKELKLISIKANGDVKMQAYERMTLFLERLKPSSLVEKFNKELAIHEYIYLLEKTISEEFDYNKVLKFKGNNNESYSLFHNYNVLKILYFFDKEFGISYSKDFYLNTLRYCNVGNLSNNDSNIFDYIKEKVNDIDIFNQQVITNINEDNLDDFSLRTHIDYALENKLEKTYSKIEKFILEEGYSTKDFMERFIKLIPDKVSFLKKCYQ